MKFPWQRTIQALSDSDEATAGPLLLVAARSPVAAFATAAIKAVLERTSVRDQIEALRLCGTLSAPPLAIIHHCASGLQRAFRQLLLEGTASERQVTLQLLIDASTFQQLPLLLELTLKAGAIPQSELVAAVLVLADRMYDARRRYITDPMNAESVIEAENLRPVLLSQIERTLQQPVNETAMNLHVELLVMLGPISDPALHAALWRGRQEVRDQILYTLATCPHPSIARRLIELLREPYPHPRTFEILAGRNDLVFIANFLRELPAAPSGQLYENLQQVSSVEWLEHDLTALELLPADTQLKLITFVIVTGIDRAVKAAVHQWILENGTVEAKSVASRNTALVDVDAVQSMLIRNLNSDDASTQAWATAHLRESNLPDAFLLLVERLDSVLPEVRAAARAELASFNVDRVISMIDTLEGAQAASAGQLLLKVDTQAVPAIQRELAHLLRPRRTAMMNHLIKLSLTTEFADAILPFAIDSDATTRQQAAGALQSCRDHRAGMALQRLTGDPQALVREAALRAFDHWTRAQGSESICAFADQWATEGAL